MVGTIVCAHDRSRAGDGNRDAEVIVVNGVGALQFGDLCPAGRRLGEHVRPAGTILAPLGAPTIAVVPNPATEMAKVVTGNGVSALQFGGLFPTACRLGEHIHPASTVCVSVCTHHSDST